MGIHPSDNNNSRTVSISRAEDNPAKSAETVDKTSSSSGSLPPVQRKAWTERGQLLLNFHDVISRAINSPEMIKKCSQIAADMSEHENTASNERTLHTLADDYSAEANLIIKNKMRRDAEVQKKTLVTGLFVFGLLRGGRGMRMWIRNMAANRAAETRRYKFDSYPDSGTTQTKFVANQPTMFSKCFRLGVDLTISTTIALFSGEYLFIPRPSSYIEDMAKLPLVEGKSLYAEMVCPPLLKEYKNVVEKYGRWPVMNPGIAAKSPDVKTALTQEDVSLNIIRRFAENCSKRSKYEQAILQEREVLANHRNGYPGLELFHRITNGRYTKRDEIVKLGDVSVPSGGVPEDVYVDLEKDVVALLDDVPNNEKDR